MTTKTAERETGGAATRTSPDGADAQPGPATPAGNGAAAADESPARDVEVAIVGSGFSGIAMAVALRRAGWRDFVLLERAHDVGGTWRDNTYPGCRCDVPSHVYSFSFAPNPNWSSTFSPQQEIWDYLRTVAEDHGVMPHVRFGCELTDARWDADAHRWALESSSGPLRARFLVAAPGPLHEPKIPDIPGLSDFEGTMFHSARWDHSHRLEGERVAVIGTGASAIQFIPQIQPKVERLYVFQRSPAWIMPRADRRITRAERLLFRRLPATQRAVRAAIYWARELFAIPMLRASLAPILRRIGLRHLRHQVRDPELRAKLTPDYLPGCKRILVANDYLPAMGQPNVELVCDRVAEVRANAIVTADGAEHEVDTIILGTGFHVTDMPIADRVRDAEGRSLAEHWDGSPQAHRGTTVAGFPNLFFLLGPNTGLGHNSVVYMAEAQVGYVMQALEHARAHRLAALAPTAEAQRRWNEEVQRRMRGTVWLEGGCSSWYIDSKGRNTTLWPDFSFRFARALRRFDPAEHEVERERAPVAARV